VVPPLNPPRPTTVYLCDYGVHSSLLLPTGDGRYVEYLYGDWNWAALWHNSWVDAVSAVFWSQQAALGRRFITPALGEVPQPPGGSLTEVSITVDGKLCEAVIQSLDARWEVNLPTALTPDPPQDRMDFVKDDQPYSWLHDCNRLTADSLAQMGCRIIGYPIWSKFDVAAPAK
jgi:hypothetical protein